MLKNYFIAISLLSLLSVKAQTPIKIYAADMPAASLLTVRDSVLVNLTNSIGTMDPTVAGPNFNLDYSFLTYTSQQFETFDAPATFSSPFNLLFNVFNTSYGKENKSFTSIPGVPITGAYDFFKVSSTLFKQTGSGFFVNGTPLPFLYSSADVVYKFPMNYLNQDSCDYKFGLPIPTLGYYGQKGHRVNVVDGWGTLTTPEGVFQTLRIKSTIATIDTIYLSSFSLGSNVPRPLKTEYKWFASGKKIPVLEIDVTGGVNTVKYFNPSMVGIYENTTKQFNMAVFPNPFLNDFSLTYTLPSTTNVKIVLMDVVGKIVARVSDQIEALGTHQLFINKNEFNLSAGVYFLKLEANNYKEIKKIVVAKY